MDALIAEVLKLGLPGAVIVGLGLAVRSLWNDNKELTKLLVELTGKTSTAVEANSAALNRITEAMNNRKGLQ
jgi:hypothetical protein